jgi:hypothetical protein
MSRRVRVFAGMLIGRTVATQRDAALLTGSEMKPLRADLYTFDAFAHFGLFHRFDGVEMRAWTIGHF